MVEKQEIIIRYHRQGHSERQISRELGIHRSTVRKYLKDHKNNRALLNDSGQPDETIIAQLVEAPKYNNSNRGKRKLTQEITSEIDKLLALNQQKTGQGLHKQTLKKIDILEYLQGKGFDVGYTTVCNYISQKNKKPKEAFISQHYQPGEVCEFDWGEVKLYIAGKLQKLNMAVFTSAMSNYRFAVLFYRQDTTSFQRAHVLFFDHVEGVYQSLVYDNTRVVISKFVGQHEKQPTEALLKLSMYYHFAFRFCNARKGNEKGHVERSVEYLRRKAFCLKDSFDNIEEANKWLQTTCNRLNSYYSKFTRGARPIDLFKEEKSHLYPVPPAFDCAILDQCRVDKYSTIRYSTNIYSVPDDLVGEIIDIKVYPEQIVCYHGTKQLCVHQRSYGKHQWLLELDHYLNTLKIKPGALASSRALKSAPVKVKAIYQRHFRENPKAFVEMLLFARDNDIEFSAIEKVIARLMKICPGDISLDKIKALCMQDEDKVQPVGLDNNDPILTHSNAQLQEYCTFLS
jgi:transposase